MLGMVFSGIGSLSHHTAVPAAHLYTPLHHTAPLQPSQGQYRAQGPLLKYQSKIEWLAKLHSNSLFTWGIRIYCLEAVLGIPQS